MAEFDVSLEYVKEHHPSFVTRVENRILAGKAKDLKDAAIEDIRFVIHWGEYIDGSEPNFNETYDSKRTRENLYEYYHDKVFCTLYARKSKWHLRETIKEIDELNMPEAMYAELEERNKHQPTSTADYRRFLSSLGF